MLSVEQPLSVKRSAGALASRRKALPWPRERDFRILSIDGGGIKGIFPATVLAGLEDRFLGGKSIARYFDLVAGTSTGGIIALGLAAGLTAKSIAELYINHGGTIFPPGGDSLLGRLATKWRRARQLATYVYEREPLKAFLNEALGERLLEDAVCRLNIPAFEGRHGETYIYKTPHHPDFHLDRGERMTTVAFATSAAPTFFRALPQRDYIMVDGGVWANNPAMIALTDALSCFDVDRHSVSILSIGCGVEPFKVADKLITGGMYHWRKAISAAMHLQSQNAIGQACLIVGAERVLRVEPPLFHPAIEMDDYLRAKALLPFAAASSVDAHGARIEQQFLHMEVDAYVPFAQQLERASL
jgi:patatin-like phospholipase/acyl hydrolase